jgi:hypothetical protein
MLLKLPRLYPKENYTIGKLYINDIFFCDSLEDKVRDFTEEKKVPGQTAIPAGTYRIVMSYSERFGRMLPELLYVPFFSAIRIHPLNTALQTEGCIGVGKNNIVGGLTYSRHFSDKLNEILSDVKDEKIFIEIT